MLKFKNGKTFPKKPLDEYSFDDIKYIISQCNNITNILDILELNYSYRKKIKEFIEAHNIPVTHFISRRTTKNNYQSHQSVKNKFMKENEHKCTICNLGTTWNNKPLVLQLDHINGNHFDNSKENLRLLCPNCHTQTHTFCSRNFKNRKNLFKHCKSCKKNITKNNISNMCKECYFESIKKDNISEKFIKTLTPPIKQCSSCNKDIKRKSKTGLCSNCVKSTCRKVERPSFDILIKDINDLGYLQTGKKYSVSDNAIRKWVRNFQGNPTKENIIK
jgi:hypothetical protein